MLSYLSKEEKDEVVPGQDIFQETKRSEQKRQKVAPQRKLQTIVQAVLEKKRNFKSTLTKVFSIYKS